MNATEGKVDTGKWRTPWTLVRKILVTLLTLAVISSVSYVVTKAINAPSASEVKEMISTGISGSALMTQGAETALTEMAIENQSAHTDIKTDLAIIQGQLSILILQAKEKGVK